MLHFYRKSGSRVLYKYAIGNEKLHEILISSTFMIFPN